MKKTSPSLNAINAIRAAITAAHPGIVVDFDITAKDMMRIAVHGNGADSVSNTFPIATLKRDQQAIASTMIYGWQLVLEGRPE